MSTIEKAIDVNAPVQTVYNQWTQFEEFPRFMEGVEEVRQINDKDLQWRVNIGGQRKEFETVITEQIPDKRIAWRTRGGVENGGVVTFHRVSDTVTRVMLQMEYQPEGLVEKAGDFLGITSHRIEGDLERFKEFVEKRGMESGAWRGTISNPNAGQPTR
jgi:uncharacterized membrane protein